jgi:adenylate kinase
MRLVILGPPGSGKGTQAKELAKDLKLKHISSGDLLRREVAKNSVLGKKIKPYMKKGDLIPDILMDHFMKKVVPKNNYIIDGYPRRIKEAEYLDTIADIEQVIFLDVPFHVLQARLLKRAKIEGREDDNLETIKERFKVYREETQPLLKYYKDKILLIDGDNTPDAIERELLKLLKNANRNLKIKP